MQGARFTYKTYVLTLTFADAKGATAASFTKTEVATEQSKGSTNIKLTNSKSLPGAVILSYDFPNPATPSIVMRGRRYYISFADGRMAMVTLTGQADRFRNIIAQTVANSLKLAR